MDSCLKNLRNEITEPQRASFRKEDFIIGVSEKGSRVQREGFGARQYPAIRWDLWKGRLAETKVKFGEESELVRLVVSARCLSRCLLCLCQVVTAFRQGSHREETKAASTEFSSGIAGF